MANFVTCTTCHTPSATTALSANASFPVTNVNDFTHPGRLYKGSNAIAATEWVKFNMGSVVPVGALVIDNTNASSVKVFGHTSDMGNTVGAWATAAYASGATTVSQDALGGRYKLCLLPSQSLQWWLVACNTATATDGGSVWTVGGISLWGAVTTWTTNAEFPYEVTVDEGAAGTDEQPGGGYEPVTLGPSYATITLSQSKFKVQQWAELGALARLPKATPIMFFRNFGDTSEVYICRKRAAVTQSLTGPGVFTVRSLVLRELV